MNSGALRQQPDQKFFMVYHPEDRTFERVFFNQEPQCRLVPASKLSNQVKIPEPMVTVEREDPLIPELEFEPFVPFPDQ